MSKSLLTSGNPKTQKGEAAGYLTQVLHLAPAMVSGRNVCPHATVGCEAACLNTAGRGGIGLAQYGTNAIQQARIARTRWFHADREGFLAQLVWELERHVRKARRLGLHPTARLNGTSDLPWERFAVRRGGVEHSNVFHAFPEVTFYDYTKWPPRLRHPELAPGNYSLTYSLAESNDEKLADAFERGDNVAVVFRTRRGQPLPARFRDRRVIDGDKHDLRFLDERGVIVGLRAKGRAISDASGFVREGDES